ncbi:sulfotransferase domain-containing protein [Glycocaulis sp.]|uniref:sulfotransferase domain-containing protein n=1 Tax=Glycocaulis sp. TaxID=1969725 RepID=UPI003F70130E
MIGGMRCGTRAMLRYLSQHPQLCPHEKAHDPHFFSSDENWKKGLSWYLSGWAEFDPETHLYGLESSTHYTKYPLIKRVPERMRRSGLDFTFIYAMRDPIERIESHFVHNAGKGYVDPDNPKARARFLAQALAYSDYNMQLERFENAFPGKRLFIYALEDLQQRRAELLGRLSEFLQIDSFPFEEVPYVRTKLSENAQKIRLTEAEKEAAAHKLADGISALASRGVIDPGKWQTYSQYAPKRVVDLLEPRPACPAVNRLGSRLAFLTVDTEAMRYRAKNRHVNKLIWGEHPKGRAGIREMAAIGKEFGARHVFFLDMCEEELFGESIAEVARYLGDAGEDVQLHAHPEILPDTFWARHDLPSEPSQMNEFDKSRAHFVLKHFADRLAQLTGRPTLAYRAGSFRWSGATIEAMAEAGLQLSFNASHKSAAMGRGAQPAELDGPYRWSNGVIEIPLTEEQRDESVFASFAFPMKRDGAHNVKALYRKYALQDRSGEKRKFLNLLTHSWSLLEFDEGGKIANYVNDQRTEEYRALVGMIAKDFDILSSDQFASLPEGEREKALAPGHQLLPA